MNEVKKGLDAVSGITSEDLGEVKQRVLTGKQRQKKRNPIPAAVTALVAAAILFFAFNVLQDGFSTADDEKYEVNELIYDFMLRTESAGNEAEASDEMRQTVLQSMLQIDALIDYAKTLGYTEDMEAIDETVAEQRDAFYADLEKEVEEKKNDILQAQTDAFGITYDEYFNVLLTWTARAERASNWLVRHSQEESITRGEAIRLFQNKNERAISEFMEQKSIPPFDLSVKYDELEGTVAAIEGDQVLVTQGFVEDAPSKKEKLLLKGLASRFVIDDMSEELVPGMEIRVVYDALAYPVGTQGNPIVYEKVMDWERIESPDSKYLPNSDEGLSEADIETAFEMCVRALTDYYKAVWNGSDIDLNMFVTNENLKQYMQKKVQSQSDKYAHFNNKVKNIEISEAWEVEFTDDADGGFLYLHLPVAINKYQGGYGEPTEFLVRNENGKLVIVDWYTGAKDSYDFIVRGENETIDDPDIWNDREWVKKFTNITD
ncbi:hypothetical protein [Sporosarcina sp. SAFN-015]|uniref:hypothetical protein n=1 Tax=Sporosarcina sp. SAFN-015 TaxID=3387274 RepID=UPI003F8135F2